MADRTHRITIFKIAEKPKQERLVAAFKTLSAEHEKVTLGPHGAKRSSFDTAYYFPSGHVSPEPLLG